MGGSPGSDREGAPSQVQRDLVGDGERGRDDFHLGHEIIAHRAAKRVEIKPAARGQRLRQVPMADEDRGGRLVLEGRVAEHVVGMHMRVDDVANGLGRTSADGGHKAAPLMPAAAGIDDGDGVIADDESEIGNSAFVVMSHKRERAGVNKHTACYLRHHERFGSLLRVGSDNLL